MSEPNLSPFHKLLIYELGQSQAKGLAEFTEEQAMLRWSPVAHTTVLQLREFLKPTPQVANAVMFEIVRALVRMMGADVIAGLLVTSGGSQPHAMLPTSYNVNSLLYNTLGYARRHNVMPSGVESVEMVHTLLDDLQSELLLVPRRLERMNQSSGSVP